MNKKICKIIIVIIFILIIIVGVLYLIDLDRMSKGMPVVFSTWGAKYSPIFSKNGDRLNEQLNSNNTENYKKYSNIIDNIKIELNIPNEWKYEEVR